MISVSVALWPGISLSVKMLSFLTLMALSALFKQGSKCLTAGK
ncbi:hypothetical protein BMETH_1215_0 [methanotrophic bacterial endosymbiont of Bathymodiolus sp.]|nr:hypothetical protein BMETH_1215_0 [methanotrophic bacterial endosymbiont of Bathymodiolus sp.]